MTATAARELLHGSMRPHPSHVTPELNAALSADTDEQIEAARRYAVEALAQGHLVCASYGFTEVTRMGKLRGYYAGKEREANATVDAAPDNG